MADNLSTPTRSSADKRPHQTGKGIGVDRGSAPCSVSIEWMVDTGVEIACVTRATGANFRLKTVAGSASAPTGGGGILIKSGLTTEFEIINTSGIPTNVRCSLDVGLNRTMLVQKLSGWTK
jgi:hypothetical protein